MTTEEEVRKELTRSKEYQQLYLEEEMTKEAKRGLQE